MTLFWLWYVIILPVISINNIEDCFIFTLCINKANKQITKCLCRKAKWLLKTLTILSYLLCVCKDQISKAQEQTYCVVRKSRRPAPFWMTQCHRNASKYFVVHHGSKNPIKTSKITVQARRKQEGRVGILNDPMPQSHYRKVPRWVIFMEQEWRFGLDFGLLALLKKKIWADYEQLFSFHGQKEIKNEKMKTLAERLT